MFSSICNFVTLHSYMYVCYCAWEYERLHLCVLCVYPCAPIEFEALVIICRLDIKIKRVCLFNFSALLDVSACEYLFCEYLFLLLM